VRQGAATLGTLAADAVKRYAAAGGKGKTLFTDDERQQLADALAATQATAELLGRARVHRRLKQAAGSRSNNSATKFSDRPTDWSCFDDSPISPLAPLKALEWFRSLVPVAGVRDRKAWAAAHGREAFSLAKVTEQTLLEKIHAALARGLETGEVGDAAEQVEKLLDSAGVTPENPEYAANVFRTNMMQAFNAGTEAEMRDPDVRDEFPVWRFDGIPDGRQRPSHRVHQGKYFPSDVTFAEVRDSVKGSFDGFQCRCAPTPIWRGDWEDLQKRGAAVSKFAESLPVPHLRQATGYTCGPAALAEVAKYFGVGPPHDLAARLGSDPDDGTPPAAMLAGAKALGLHAEARQGWTLPQLERSLIRGRPVIVAMQAWGSPEGYAAEESGHWTVVAGVDRTHVSFADPAANGARVRLPRAEFLRRWRDRDGAGNEYLRYGMALSRAAPV
jgi:predicted double-glycine peptidase